MTENKAYHLPKQDRKFTFDEIEDLILAGKVQKSTKIWEKSLTDWMKISKHPDFVKTFEQFDLIAKEKISRALGTDEETVKKREMIKMFDDVGDEEFEQKSDNNFFKWIIIGLFIIGIPFGGFFVLELLNKAPEVKEPVKKEVRVDDINLKNVKFGSGVMSIDSIKGVTVKQVEKNEEDEILKEVLLELKKEKKKEVAKASAQKKADKKGSGLFDKVSEDELNSFRNSFLNKTKSKKIAGGSVKGSKFAKSKEELTGKQINRTIKKYYSTIKYCYNKALKDDTGIRGKMELTLHILGNGKVAKVVNETPKFKGTAMNRCVTKQIKSKWQFPKFNGTLTTVTIPFILSAQ